MIAAILQGPIARLVPVGVVLLALQTTLFAEVQPGGVYVQLLLALAAATGAGAGPDNGAIAGFTLGLVYDLGVGTPIGSSALTMAIGGVVAGSIGILNIEPTWWLSALFTMAGAAAGEAAVPMVRIFVSEVEGFGSGLFRIVAVVSISAGVLSPLFVPLGRWCVRVKGSEWKAPAETREPV